MPTMTSEEVALTSTAVGNLPWEPLDVAPGVEVKTLWRDPSGTSYAGLMKMRPGARLQRHRHRFATHHAWVESGSCRIDDRSYGPGSYLYVPVGVEHGIDEAGPGGCTLLYLYLSRAELD